MLKWPPSPAVLLGYIAVIATIAAMVSASVALTTARSNKDRIEDIEKVQVDACNGRNQLRQVLRTQIQRQIDQSIAFEQSGQYAQFFPNIPTAQLHATLAEQRKSQLADKDKLAAEDCTAVG